VPGRLNESTQERMIELHHGDMRDVLARLHAEGAQFDACVTDPPYHLTSIVKRFGADNAAPAKPGTDGAFARASRGFMGQKWDGGDIAFRPETWHAVYDALKPGAHLVAFGGTRTMHRIVCAIEDAGFEIRDGLAWLYGSGFPKSHDVSKGIDKAAGAEREVIGEWHMPGRGTRSPEQKYGLTADHGTVTAPATPAASAWAGWGTALKPAFEPIVLARKPLDGTVAANVLAHGTGAINIDASRIPTNGETFTAPQSDPANRRGVVGSAMQARSDTERNQAAQRASIDRLKTLGRWPANVLHDGSADVESAFGGSASRFFYSAKADKADRADSGHPTVKPIDLMRWLVTLITPPGGTVLDPFAGSGSTGEAAMLGGFDAHLIEREAEYAADIRHRIKRWSGLDAPLFAMA
jgi:DNA modification methylase